MCDKLKLPGCGAETQVGSHSLFLSSAGNSNCGRSSFLTDGPKSAPNSGRSLRRFSHIVLFRVHIGCWSGASEHCGVNSAFYIIHEGRLACYCDGCAFNYLSRVEVNTHRPGNRKEKYLGLSRGIEGGGGGLIGGGGGDQSINNIDSL